MEKHIKELGEFEVEIKLYHSVNANIKIKVVNLDEQAAAEEVKEENNAAAVEA